MSNDERRQNDGNGPSQKISSPLQQEIERGGPTVAANQAVKVRIHTARGRREEAHRHAERNGATVEASYGTTIIGTVPRNRVRGLAKSNAVDLVGLYQEPEEHGTVSEGVDITGADLLHDIDLTGDGIEIAIIDGAFNEVNDKYEDQVIGTIGDGIFDDSDDADDQLGQHGTACAEIVSDMAPDADLILASTRGISMSDIIDTLTTDFDPDVATMSLGFPWDTRIDGKDDLSNLIKNKFTSDGRLFATSAGNDAAGDTWNGDFSGGVGDLMEFDDDGSTRLEVRTRGTWDTSGDTGTVYVHWDAPWDPDNRGYKVRLWPDEDTTDSGDLIAESETNLPFEAISFTQNDNPPVYLEIEHTGTPNDVTGDEHFDLLAWRSKIRFANSKPGHSIGRPATSRDPNTLAVAAVQATAAGRMPNAEDLKNYSSRGPTQRGRRGIDIAAPSNVEQLERNRFNGTSAASPHVGGAAGLLFDADIGATRDEIREALFDAGRGIEDPDVGDPGPNNTEIGFGYLDARGARDLLEGIMVTLDEKWAYDTASRTQFSTPTVDAHAVYVGGLGTEFFALARADGTEAWTRSRDGALSDSSPHLSNGTIFVGSGGGVLYAINDGDGRVEWTYTTGSAITSSPVVDNGTVYVGTNDRTVHAVAVSTGSQQWTADVPAAVYSDLVAANGTVFVTTRDGRVIALRSGSVDWQYDAGTALGSSSPTALGTTLYVAADDVLALDAGTGAVQWTQSYGGAAGSNPVVDSTNDIVYVGSADGFLYAFDAVTGTREWRTAVGDSDPIASSPAVADERVVVATRAGEVELIDAFLQPGDRIDAASLSSQTRSSPTVDENEVYIGSRAGRIFAFTGE